MSAQQEEIIKVCEVCFFIMSHDCFDVATDEEEQASRAGIAEYTNQGKWLADLNEDEEHGSDHYFSIDACDCCGNKYHGNRYPVVVMSDQEEATK